MAIGTLLGIGQGVSLLRDYLNNRSSAKQYNRMSAEEIDRLGKMKKQPFINVNSILSGYDRGIATDSAKQGMRLDKTLGLDVGQAQGQLASNQIGARSKLLGDLRLQNDVGTSNRNMAIDDRISQLRMNKAQTPGFSDLALGLGQTALNTYANNKAQSDAQKQAEKLALLNANTAPKPVGTMQYENDYSPRVDYNQLNQQGVNQSAGYNYDNAGGFDQQQNAPKFKNPNEYIAYMLQNGQLDLKDYLTKFGTVGGSKSGYKPPTPTKTSSEVDSFIKDRSQGILDQNRVEDREQLSNLVQQNLSNTKWNWGNILPGGDPFITQNPDTTGVGALKQLDWYNNPSNRSAIANDSLPNYKPELFGLPQEYENAGMSMFSDWDELDYQEKIEALKRKGIIQ